MKLGKVFKYTILIAFFPIVTYLLITYLPGLLVKNTGIRVLLIQNKLQAGEFAYIGEAYKSVLEEEGVPFSFEYPSFLLASEPADVVKTYPVIIFADYIAQSLPTDFESWMKEYLKHGGNVAVIYDAGTKDLKNKYRTKAIFADIVGINYITYNQSPDSSKSYTTGYIRFKDQKSGDLFQIPPGKLDDQFYINGYSYGQLVFPFARLDRKPRLDRKTIYAYGETSSGEMYPLIILKKVLSGKMLYVNLPLGHLKVNSDDLMIRSIIRTFLFDVVKIPHLLNVPDGKGGLVINWHIDWKEDWEGLTFMLNNGYFSPYLQYSIHNTAGDFTDRPGDQLGFDACGRGRPYLKAVLKYGTLGSHGGWGHNWFYQNILNNNFSEADIEKYIVKNNQCLQGISGYPVIEYSAPNGVHPQPLLTRILERNGIIAYYYAGDSGSAPNRTFFDKKMISPNVFAFPVLSFRKTASFFEMKSQGVTDAQLQKWFNDLLSFVIEKRTIRLIYSHSYDVPPYYPIVLREFIRSVEAKARQGQVQVKAMSYFSHFLKRFVKTKSSFSLDTGTLDVNISNPEGLKGIVIALPKGKYKMVHWKGIDLSEDKDYHYLRINENVDEKILHIGYINH